MNGLVVDYVEKAPIQYQLFTSPNSINVTTNLTVAQPRQLRYFLGKNLTLPIFPNTSSQLEPLGNVSLINNTVSNGQYQLLVIINDSPDTRLWSSVLTSWGYKIKRDWVVYLLSLYIVGLIII